MTADTVVAGQRVSRTLRWGLMSSVGNARKRRIVAGSAPEVTYQDHLLLNSSRGIMQTVIMIVHTRCKSWYADRVELRSVESAS